jgi:hypothetical protein
MYKPGGTIFAALQRIQQKRYVLPALQREFVWKPEQIERLFDSLMQGYPFGTFLLWRVDPATSAMFRFYDFILNYHERDAAHCPELPPLHNEAVHAILDGQQRLSALNIGLRGSLAHKAPNKWRTSPDAYPRRSLHLNVLASLEPDEDGNVYKFSFRKDVDGQHVDGALWFKVSEILGLSAGPDMLSALMGKGLAGAELQRAFKTLDRLHRVVHTEQLIHYYEEETQDIPRVLNIFIRLNAGGTVLSYSDLLLSTAVAQWKKLDARAEIHTLVDELNRIGTGFNFSHDFVLKAGLMLADIASVGFKVENFTPANTTKLEAQWQAIRTALVRTVDLTASFGFNGQTLRADSALLPIAYYLYARGAPHNYVTHSQFASDRDRIRKWLACCLLKASGIWGSGLDTLLTALREVLQKSDGTHFPDTGIRYAMNSRGKTLQFSEAEIDDLLSLEYGDKRTFILLSLLFPFIDLRNQFHVDHVFPISRFKPAKLRAAGIPEDKHEHLLEKANLLPNLQLLEGAANNEKRTSLPAAWLVKTFPVVSDRDLYCMKHLLGQVPDAIQDCETFWEARRERLRLAIDGLVNEKPSVETQPRG